jgi:hypothetical protein
MAQNDGNETNDNEADEDCDFALPRRRVSDAAKREQQRNAQLRRDWRGQRDKEDAGFAQRLADGFSDGVGDSEDDDDSDGDDD